VPEITRQAEVEIAGQGQFEPAARLPFPAFNGAVPEAILASRLPL
jgi:hypothetical protein